MPQDLPRFAPDIPFPPYTYIPKKTPHPTSDPAGHSFGLHSPSLPATLHDWRRSVEYRQGIDLFNFGYYWESHEVWEGLWHAAGRKGPLAKVLQGLIKLAAAGVKTIAGSEPGRIRHLRRAAELFDLAAAASLAEQNAIVRGTGLSPQQLASWTRAAAADVYPAPVEESDSLPGHAVSGPERVFTFCLVPAEVGEG